MQWWERRRLRYNLWLIAALVGGGFTTLLVMDMFQDRIFAPIVDEKGKFIAYDDDIGGVAILGPCCASVMGIGLANVCFFLGALCERFVQQEHVAAYRKWAWRLGLWFSCLLPFSVALLHLVFCLFFPQWYDRTPIVVGGWQGLVP